MILGKINWLQILQMYEKVQNDLQKIICYNCAEKLRNDL